MTILDQNSAYTSQSEALVPGATMMDGRTEADLLNFLCEFSKLINFYDSTNTVNGNWSPFLLKDPVFLTAHISKTKVSSFYNPYYNASLQLQDYFSKAPHDYKHSCSVAFNQIFDQLTLVVMHIERWTYYMQLADEHYELKHYLISQVKTKFGAYFWALLSLREYLFTTTAIPDIERVFYYLFEGYDELTWKQSMDKVPFWQVLEMSGIEIDIQSAGPELTTETAKALLKDPELEKDGKFYYLWEYPPFPLKTVLPGYQVQVAQTCFEAIKMVGDELFNFFHAIVHNAADELVKLNSMHSRYPDTTLLRTFLSLLKVHQDQLNGLPAKHLDFYYKDILTQVEKPAKADTALLFATLPATGAAFVLPAGTLFSGGVDANKNPIVFSNANAVCLNPATITSAYTLSLNTAYVNGGEASPVAMNAFFLQPVTTPCLAQTSESGALQSWQTFGGTPPSTLQAATTAMAFASPMLFLKEGQRTIWLTITYTGELGQSTLQNAAYYLSMQTAWQNLVVTTGSVFPDLTQSSILISNSVPVAAMENQPAANSITLRIDLPPSQPAIQAFTKNPDGLSSPWPMFKIEFTGLGDVTSPPVITTLTIETTVTGLSSTLQLYCDSGALSTKNPYQPFGPLPLLNSNFIIGSAEMFSKPLSSLYLTLQWNNLPADFSIYYALYNQYLAVYQPAPVAASGISNPAISLNPLQGAEETSTDKTQTPVASPPPVVKKPSLLSKILSFPRKVINSVKARFVSFRNSIRDTIKRVNDKIESGVHAVETAAAKIKAKVISVISAIKNRIIPPAKTPTQGTPTQTTPTPVTTTPLLPATTSATPPTCGTVYNNACFTVNAYTLQQNAWQSLESASPAFNPLGSVTVSSMNAISSTPYTPGSSCCVPFPAPPGIPLFGTTDITNSVGNAVCTLLDTSFFSIVGTPSANNAGSLNPISQFAPADPLLQTTPLKYSDTSTDGFIKMSIANPPSGFGSAFFANVVTWIAMQNAIIIRNAAGAAPTASPPSPPAQTLTYDIPGPAFSPKLSNITAHYTAIQTYQLNSPTGEYPLQCFMYTPFEKFLIYDNSVDPSLYMNDVVTSLCDVNPNAGNNDPEPAGLPLFPTLSYQGVLYLGLQNLITPNPLSLYFQMAQSYSSSAGTKAPDLYYLTQTGWNVLPVTADSTNNLTCSGIITVDIPADITNQSTAMPAGSYWLALAVSDSPDAHSQTVMVNVNGISVKRTGTNFLSSTQAPVLAAAVITKPATVIPQIKSISQPFPSFGGKAAETKAGMNLRVSNRLKTKGRAASAVDYYRLIKQKFNTVYYSKAIYNPFVNATQVYVVQGFDSWQDAGAFIPMITECMMSDIQTYLSDRSPAFAPILVMNFRLIQVSVTANITVSEGYSGSGVIKSVSQALNVFLSPWINSDEPQITINQGVTLDQVTSFIGSLPGVNTVSDVAIPQLPEVSQAAVLSASVTSLGLIVSSMNHQITVLLQ